MEYKIEDKLKSEKEITVTIASKDVENHIEKAINNLSAEMKIPGFRPGKAPAEMVKERIGQEKIWQEACYEAINETYLKIIDQEKINVISSPKIDILKIENNKPLVYKALVAVFPVIVLSDYKKQAKKINKDKKKINVEQKEVDQALETVRKSRAKTIRVFRESQQNDEVIFNFQGKVDGVAQEGLKANNVPMLLGENSFIKGFNENLIGVKEQDKKTFILKIPFEEGLEKDVEFDVEILAVNKKELPELNDDFAKSLGDFSNLEELKKKIKENIEKENEIKEKERIRFNIIEEIIKDLSIQIPDVLIEKETENILNQFKNQFIEPFEGYLKKIGKTENDLKREWKDKAEKRILASLILQEIALKENVLVTDEEIEKEKEIYLNQIQDNQEKEKININNLKIYLKESIENQKVFEILESL